MIRIGEHIAIVEQDVLTTSTTKVFFRGNLLGTIQHIKMEWDANDVIPTKHCSAMSLEEEYDPVLEEFAIELGRYGFWVEIQYPKSDMIVEFYHVNGEQEREEKRGAKDSLHRE